MAGDLPVDRRSVLSAIGAGMAGLAGCAGVTGNDPERVSLLAAGSLHNALENGFQPDVDGTVEVEARGSAAAARLVAAGQRDPDILSLADTALFDSSLDSAWLAEFATNSLVVAYNPDTEGGQRLADAGSDGWYQPLVDGDVSLGRTDPALDPLGYRTLFMFELATDYYDTAVGLQEAILSREQRYPETQLVSQFETGSIDAAVTYRNMVVDRDYECLELPAAIDLSDPTLADRYARASYELPSGTVVTGGPISYGSTIRRQSPMVRDVFEAHVTGDYLSEFGFIVPDDYPRYSDNVPETVTD
ncbi:MAG: extracellular solute-binding protein [Euryarchaeota archaeon]|nr:extracellular solute-binding protein [Euryarchaeota archaeon]